MSERITLPTAYLGNVQYYYLLLKHKKIQIEIKEHFIKQSYRNRCEIYGANGKLNLIVPLKKWRNHSAVDEIEISYDSNWQQIHWRSIESAYRSSPFFEFYEDDFKSFYESKNYNLLIDWNTALLELTLDLLQIDVDHTYSEKFDKENSTNSLFNATPGSDPQLKFPKYMQVFSSKFGQLDNLSIVDLLFNLGPETLKYLKALELK